MATEVRFKATHMVKPAEKTWIGTIALTESEFLLRRNFVSMLYLYTCANSDAAVVESLSAALAKALVKYYPFTAKLKPSEGGIGRVVLECEEATAWVLLVEAEEASGVTVADVAGGLPEGVAWGENKRFDHLLPAVDWSKPLEELPLLMAQVTRFRCGGLSLGLRLSHAVADGIGMGHFLSHWSRLARGEPSDVEPVHDRSLLRAWEPLRSAVPCFQYSAPPTPLHPREDLVLINMVISKSQLDELKKIAGGVTSGRAYSRFEVLVAHSWRCLRRIKEEESNDGLHVLGFVMDVRKRLNPPLPLLYSGNAVISIATTNDFSDVTLSSLSYVCAKIRQSIENVDAEYVWRHLDQMKSQMEHPIWPQSIWTREGLVVSPDMLITSWLTLSYYNMDFGWGKETHFLALAPQTLGRVFLMPGQEEGSVVLSTCLEEDQVDKFNKYFYEDLV